MKQVPSVRQAALAAGRMKYSNYFRLPCRMTGLQKLTCSRGGERKTRKFGVLLLLLLLLFCSMTQLHKMLFSNREYIPKHVHIFKNFVYHPHKSWIDGERKGGREWKGGSFPKLHALGSPPTVDTASVLLVLCLV